MAGEAGPGVLPPGAGEPRALLEPQPRGDRSFPGGRRAHSPRHPVADHDPGHLAGPRGRAAVLAPLAGGLGKFFPGGPQCSYQGTCLPDPGLGLSWMRETAEERPGRERRREYSSPPDRPRTSHPFPISNCLHRTAIHVFAEDMEAVRHLGL